MNVALRLSTQVGCHKHLSLINYIPALPPTNSKTLNHLIYEFYGSQKQTVNSWFNSYMLNV